MEKRRSYGNFEVATKHFYERLTRQARQGTVEVLGNDLHWFLTDTSLTLTVLGEDGLKRTYRRPKGYGQTNMVLWAFFCTWIGKLSHKKLGYRGSTMIR